MKSFFYLFFPALFVIVLVSGCLTGQTVGTADDDYLDPSLPMVLSPEPALPLEGVPLLAELNISCSPDDTQNCGGYCGQRCPAYCQIVQQNAGGLRQAVCPDGRCACVCECLSGTFFVA